MADDKHIVIVTPGFAADEKDFNCIPSLQLFVLGLKEYYPEIKISIITLGYPSKKENYKWRNINIYAIKEAKKVMKFFNYFRVLRIFKKIHKEKTVSSIHSLWLLEPTLIGYLLSKKFKIPFIATAQGQDTKKENLYLKLFKYLNIKITSCSEFNAMELYKSSGIKTDSIIPFGINFHPDFFPAYDANKTRTIDIIGVGSLSPVKNYTSFINIIYELKKDFPNLKSMLIGGGVEFNKLTKLIKEYDLEQNLILTGPIESRMEVMNKLNESKIFLHTALHEGQCYAFMEAAAYGLEIVTSNVGYPPPSEKTHIGCSERELVEIIKILLIKKMDFKPIHTLTMRETVISFNNLYSSY